MFLSQWVYFSGSDSLFSSFSEEEIKKDNGLEKEHDTKEENPNNRHDYKKCIIKPACII